jgi:hypothetical protein
MVEADSLQLVVTGIIILIVVSSGAINSTRLHKLGQS